MPFAHKRGVHIYVALNSVIAAIEVPELIDTLNAVSSLNPDALIIQDPGLFYLVRRWFPGLKLHASTLTAVHNSAGVRALQAMGANRVVLARELSMVEIQKICDSTETRSGDLHSWSALLFLFGAVSGEQFPRRPKRSSRPVRSAMPPEVPSGKKGGVFPFVQ